MFDITTPYMLYVRDKHTVCAVPDFPIQAPIHLYTTMAFMHGNAKLCGIRNLNDITANTL